MKLYKYRSINDHTKDIFRNKKIYFPKPTEFNDPFDCQIEFEDDITVDIYKQFIKKHSIENSLSEEQVNEWHNLAFCSCCGNSLTSSAVTKIKDAINSFEDYFKNLGILTLSEKEDNILMWSHYAKYHTGICIGIDIPESKALITVKYPESYPIIKYSEVLLGHDPTDLIKRIINTKSIDWKYEQERRMFISNGNTENDLPGEITAIYFGCECEDNNVRDIIGLCNTINNCEFFKASKSKKEFKLEFSKIN